MNLHRKLTHFDKMGVLLLIVLLSSIMLLQLQLSRAFHGGCLTTSSTGISSSLLSSRNRVRSSIVMAAAVTGTTTHTDDQPTSDKDNLKGQVARGACSLIIPLAATLGLSNPLTAYAAASSGPMGSSQTNRQQLSGPPQEEGPSNRKEDALDRYLESLPLGKDAYTTLGGGDSPLITCKVLNGMWQVGMHHHAITMIL